MASLCQRKNVGARAGRKAPRSVASRLCRHARGRRLLRRQRRENLDCQAQRARQDLGQGFSHESCTRCAREERVGPRSASTRTQRGASARKPGQRAPVRGRERAAAAGFLGQERRADQARGAGAASRWQRRGTRSSGRAAAGSVDFASFSPSESPA